MVFQNESCCLQCIFVMVWCNMYISRYNHSNTKPSQLLSAANWKQCYNDHHGYDSVIIELIMGHFASMESTTFITDIKWKCSILIGDNTRLLQIATCAQGADYKIKQYQFKLRHISPIVSQTPGIKTVCSTIRCPLTFLDNYISI